MRKTLVLTFILLFHGIVHGANRCEQLGQSLAEITKQQAAMFPAKGGLSFEELNKEADRLKAEIIILETIKAAKDNLFETEDKQKKISKMKPHPELYETLERANEDYLQAANSFADHIENIILQHSGIQIETDDLVNDPVKSKNFNSLLNQYFEKESTADRDQLMNSILDEVLGENKEKYSLSQRKAQALAITYNERQEAIQSVESSQNELVRKAIQQELEQFQEKHKLKQDIEQVKQTLQNVSSSLTDYCSNKSVREKNFFTRKGNAITCQVQIKHSSAIDRYLYVDKNNQNVALNAEIDKLENGTVLTKLANISRKYCSNELKCQAHFDTFGDLFNDQTREELARVVKNHKRERQDILDGKVNEKDEEEIKLNGLKNYLFRRLQNELGNSNVNLKLAEVFKEVGNKFNCPISSSNLDYRKIKECELPTKRKLSNEISEKTKALKNTQQLITQSINEAIKNPSFKQLETLKFASFKNYQHNGCDQGQIKQDPFELPTCSRENFSDTNTIDSFVNSLQKARDATMVSSYINELGYKNSNQIDSDLNNWKSTYRTQCGDYQKAIRADDGFNCFGEDSEQVPMCVSCSLIKSRMSSLTNIEQRSDNASYNKPGSRSRSYQYDPVEEKMVEVRDASYKVIPHTFKYAFSNIRGFMQPKFNTINLKSSLVSGYYNLLNAQVGAHYMQDAQQAYQSRLQESLSDPYFQSGFYGYYPGYTPVGFSLDS